MAFKSVERLGIEQGRQEGIDQGLQQGIEREANFVSRLLNCRLGQVSGSFLVLHLMI